MSVEMALFLRTEPSLLLANHHLNVITAHHLNIIVPTFLYHTDIYFPFTVH